jgi:hypothetical protein
MFAVQDSAPPAQSAGARSGRDHDQAHLVRRVLAAALIVFACSAPVCELTSPVTGRLPRSMFHGATAAAACAPRHLRLRGGKAVRMDGAEDGAQKTEAIDKLDELRQSLDSAVASASNKLSPAEEGAVGKGGEWLDAAVRSWRELTSPPTSAPARQLFELELDVAMPRGEGTAGARPYAPGDCVAIRAPNPPGVVAALVDLLVPRDGDGIHTYIYVCVCV